MAIYIENQSHFRDYVWSKTNSRAKLFGPSSFFRSDVNNNPIHPVDQSVQAKAKATAKFYNEAALDPLPKVSNWVVTFFTKTEIL